MANGEQAAEPEKTDDVGAAGRQHRGQKLRSK
jgi:hypothetical protein